MNRKIYLILVFLMMGCTSEEIFLKESDEYPLENPSRISLGEALKSAETIFECIDDAATRGSVRFVSSVEYIGGLDLTRSCSSGSDTLFYLVNFADNKGFAMLAADKRLENVYAISSEGSLSPWGYRVKSMSERFF